MVGSTNAASCFALVESVSGYGRPDTAFPNRIGLFLAQKLTGQVLQDST
jgi:hypothetical protein